MCGSWCQAFGSPSRKLCSSPQHQLCLSPPDRHGCPATAAPPWGSAATPGHRTGADTGCGAVLDSPTFVPLCPYVWNPPSLHIPPSLLEPIGLSLPRPELCPHGCSGFHSPKHREAGGLSLYELELTGHIPALTLQWLLPVLRIKPQGPWGLTKPWVLSVPCTNPSLMGLWPHQLPLGPSVLPLPQGLCTCRPLWPVSLHPHSSTPPLESPIGLPLSAVSPPTGVNRLCSALSRCPPFLSGVPQRLLFPGQRPPPPSLPPRPWLSPSAHQALPGPSRVQVGVRGAGCGVGGRAAGRVPRGGGGPGGRAADLRSGWSRRACSRGGRDTGSCPGS